MAEFSGTPEASSAPDDGERRGAKRRILAILTLLACTAVVALKLSSCHPAVSASLETDLPSSSGLLALNGARASEPITAELGSLALIHDGSRIPGTAEEMTIRMQVSRASCSRLAARVGGACDGSPAAPIRPRTNLKIQAAADQIFAISLTPARSERVEVAPVSERTHRGAPVAWAVAENAAKTLVEFECNASTSLTITLPPHWGTGLCKSRGVTYELDLANDGTLAPAVSLTRVQSFQGGFQSRRARIDAEGGNLTVDGDGDTLPRSTATAVELIPSQGKTVEIEVAAPAEDKWAETSLRSPHADHVLIDDEEKVKSRLEQSTRMPEWIALLIGMFLDAVISLIVIRRH